ncbi:hypothetical protein HDV04_001548 [Boothiomyces sp. JEL0838]|nr:hypothetical protein HDV04_001548 [Boothiomyces sp. JEL0838]
MNGQRNQDKEESRNGSRRGDRHSGSGYEYSRNSERERKGDHSEKYLDRDRKYDDRDGGSRSDSDRKRRADYPEESQSKKPKEEKELPNFNQSGALAKDLNTVNGILLKYSEPPEARLPDTKYRLYAFKNDKVDIIAIHRQSAYLVGRERKVCDIPLEHPSISSQHAVLQYRQVKFKDEYGIEGRKTNLYIIDLESSNGTIVNKKKIPPSRYYQLLVGDVVKFGNSSRDLTLTYPLLTVSTRSQVSTNKSRPNQIETFKKIIKDEGVVGLYAGIASGVFGISITQAIYFYWYEFMKAAYESKSKDGQDLDVLTRMAPSAVAATITTILTNPIWVVNTRLLVKNNKKMGVKDAIGEIYTEDGIAGFWKGILPAMVLVTNPVIQFAVFERLKKWIAKSARDISTFQYFLLGAYKIETEIPLGKWDDSVLIDTWNLALAEYNKYYSIDPEIRPQKKQKKKQEFVELEPKIARIESKVQIHVSNENENIEQEIKIKGVQEIIEEPMEDGEYQETEIQAQPNRLLSNLFPSREIPCDSCNESDPETSKLIDRIMPTYYKGYQDGLEGKEKEKIENRLEQAWYTAGYETGMHISTN